MRGIMKFCSFYSVFGGDKLGGCSNVLKISNIVLFVLEVLAAAFVLSVSCVLCFGVPSSSIVGFFASVAISAIFLILSYLIFRDLKVSREHSLLLDTPIRKGLSSEEGVERQEDSRLREESVSKIQLFDHLMLEDMGPVERSMKEMNNFQTVSPGFLEEIVENRISSETVKHFVRKENLTFEETLELLNALPVLHLDEEELKERLSPNLFKKVTSYGIKWLRSFARLKVDFGNLSFLFRAFCLQNCPLFLFSNFVEESFSDFSLWRIKKFFKFKKDFSLSAVAAYSVSRLGLAFRRDTFFSKKYWLFSLAAARYRGIYESMIVHYHFMNKEMFEEMVGFFMRVFDEYVGRKGGRWGISPGSIELSREDVCLLCEHGIGFSGLYFLSMLKFDQLQLLERASNVCGKNLLADLMLSIGDSLFHPRFSSMFSEEELSFRRPSRSIRGITWSELNVLLKWLEDGKEESVETFLSQLEGREIKIQSCNDQSWYTSVRLYDSASLCSNCSVLKRTSREQARVLPWINWNRSVYKRERIRKNDV